MYTYVHINALAIREGVKAKRYAREGKMACAKYHSERAKGFAIAALAIGVGQLWKVSA